MGRGRRSISTVFLIAVSTVLPAGVAAEVRPLGATLQLTHSHAENAGGPSNPTVAYNPIRREYLVVWHGPSGHVDLRSPRLALFGRRFGPGGHPLGPVVTVVPKRADPTNPQLAFNRRSRRYLLAWHLSHRARMGGRVLDARGRPLGPIRRLPSFHPAGGIQSISFPLFDLDPNPAGRGWILTWAIGPGGVLVRGVDPRGRMPGKSIPVSPPGEPAQAPTTAVNAASGELLVTWTIGHGNFGNTVRAQRVDAGSGALVGPPFDVSISGPKSRLERPAVSFNRVARRYLVVWKDVPTKRYLGAQIGVEETSTGPEDVLSEFDRSSPSGPAAVVPVLGSSTFLLGYFKQGVPVASLVGIGGVERGPFAIAPGLRWRPPAYGDISQVTLTNGGPHRILAVWSGRRARRYNRTIPRQVYAHVLRVSRR